MKYAYSTSDVEERYGNEKFENDVTKAKVIIAKVGKFSFFGYYSACFSLANPKVKSNNIYF